MEITLNDGKLEFTGDDVMIIYNYSQMIRNYMNDYRTNKIEIKEISVEDFTEWLKEMTEYMNADKRIETTNVNEYLCGLDMSTRLIENIIELRDDEVTENLIKYIKKYGDEYFGVRESVCNMMAKNGYLMGLKIAHEFGYEWNAWTCMYAAYYKHIECLKYAIENGCERNANICSDAAGSGSIECLTYAVENGCTIDIEKCLRFTNTDKIREYLEKIKCTKR